MSTVTYHPAAKDQGIKEAQLSLFLGEDRVIPLKWQTKASANATPVDVDISGVLAITGKYRESSITASPAFTLTDGSGITVTSGVAGEFNFTITKEQRDGLTTGERGFFDIIFQMSDGSEKLFPLVFSFMPRATSSGA